MNLYQRGDIEAFNFLYDKYKSLVYGYLHKRVDKRTEVDEIFQDVFLRLHHSRSQYKSEFPFEPWLFAVLRNSLIDRYRKKRKEYHNVSLYGEDFSFEEIADTLGTTSSNARQLVSRALKRLRKFIKPKDMI